MSSKPTIGFIGLGIMGMAMAKNTQAKGYPVLVTNRSEGRRKEAKSEGLSVLSTPKEIADQSDAIVIMVTDSSGVQDVLKGPGGILQGEVRNKTVIQMSTIDEPSTLKFSIQAEEAGLYFLDCPVAGSKKQVEAGQLVILAGGDPEILEKWNGPLMAMGKAIVHAGGIGKGTALKLCMNLIVSQMTTALCESVALAKVQKISPEAIFDVIRESPAINCGYFQIKEKPILEDNFKPAFSLENMLKDVRFMDEAAKHHRLALPVTQAVRFLMEAARTEGFGKEDLISIKKVLTPKISQN
ncbi:hypothetical protein BVX98_06460 [bacterium F11]|nr:hypothetical protein BVX98_06460 [bacterium F11]